MVMPRQFSQLQVSYISDFSYLKEINSRFSGRQRTCVFAYLVFTSDIAGTKYQTVATFTVDTAIWTIVNDCDGANKNYSYPWINQWLD